MRETSVGLPEKYTESAQDQTISGYHDLELPFQAANSEKLEQFGERMKSHLDLLYKVTLPCFQPFDL